MTVNLSVNHYFPGLLGRRYLQQVIWIRQIILRCYSSNIYKPAITLKVLEDSCLRTKNPLVRETAYKTLVRPQLEYAAPVWDPHTKEKIIQLEKVQRRAARWTTCNYDYQSSVTAMLDSLGWRTLEQRRADARLCLFYKIVYGLVAVPLPEYIHPVNISSLRHCHSMAFRQLHTSRDYYKYSFFPLAIVQWNALPETAVCSPDLESFKVAVSELQHTRP